MESDQKNVFLTFDDGPKEPYTSQILDILKENGVKATFFVCGKNVERYPETAKRIIAEGHTIGNHTFSHSLVKAISGFWRNEIEKTKKIIFNVTGKESKIFRPPWGMLQPWLKHYLIKNGMQVVLWNLAVKDWENPMPEVILKRVLSKAKPNDIILLHDGNEKTIWDKNRSHLIETLPVIIKELRKKGYNFKTINNH